MATETSRIKLDVNKQVELQRSNLTALSLEIHDNPELGFEENKAADLLCNYLDRWGFKVQKNVGKLQTAFKAVYGDGKPSVALLAEYDALPEIGHACGHNIIGVAAAGAGVASKCAVDEFGGSIVVLGTPAEELIGGKVLLIKEGVFRDLNIAMMIHPGSKDIITVDSLACINLEVEFIGKEAHAASCPEAGINALEAMVLSYNAVNALRQHVKDDARIHGIITDGGKAANVVPDHSSALFLVRSRQRDYLDDLKRRVLDCFTGASIATGAELRYKWGEHIYEPMKNNMHLANLFQKNLESLGHKIQNAESGYDFGSTDMGNVSQILPAIHPSIAITSRAIGIHTIEFCEAAVSKAGEKGLIDGAKAMAMTVVDILSRTEIYHEIINEFKNRKSEPAI